MQAEPSIKEKCWVYMCGTILAFVVLRFGFSPSSVSMSLRPDYDLNIYYLIGQGWMQGRLPYVELTDLKGPLVFLLHGLGAWLSPCSFAGASLLEAFIIGLGLMYAYRTARLFLSAGVAAGVIAAYSLSILYFSLHPAEIVWALQQIALYYFLRGITSGRQLGSLGQFCCGIQVAVVLLLKFNLVVFWGPFCAWAIVSAGARGWWRAFLLQMAGVASLLVPVLLYFHAHGALGSAWHEYVGVALAYSQAPWAESVLAVKGWLLAAELLPLHMHQVLPEWYAALIGWLILVPSALFVCQMQGKARLVALAVLLPAFILNAVASYAGSRCFIHYSFVFSVYLLPGLIFIGTRAAGMLKWGGGLILAGSLCFAIGLPLAVRKWRPDNGNAQMRTVSAALAGMLERDAGQGTLVLAVEHGLHLHRLSGTLPQALHFVPSMVQGGYAQHRRELLECMRSQKPRYIVGSAANRAEDEGLIRQSCGNYRALTQADLSLPAFPACAKFPEYVLYVRQE